MEFNIIPPQKIKFVEIANSGSAFVEVSAGKKDMDESDCAVAMSPGAVGGREMPFEGQPYLLGFALPNFFFHVTTAYAILRHQGVALGKRDFLGQV